MPPKSLEIKTIFNQCVDVTSSALQVMIASDKTVQDAPEFFRRPSYVQYSRFYLELIILEV